MNSLYIDIETISGADLEKTGAYRYSEDKDFRILFFGYAADYEPVRIVNLERGEEIPAEIINALTDAHVTKYAYDAQFERICLSRHLNLPQHTYLDSAQWRCLRVWAAYCGLPDNISELAAYTDLDIVPDPVAQRLLREKYMHDLRMIGGHRPVMKSGVPIVLQTLGQCVRRNVTAEWMLHNYLNQYAVPDVEWARYALSQRINDRGVMLDTELVDNAHKCDVLFRVGYERRFRELTGIDAPCSPARFRQWLATNGVSVKSLSKESVARLRKTAPAGVGEALRLWELLSRTETRKFREMHEAVCADGKLRGLFQFYGRRLGGFGYPLIQLENLPACRNTEIGELREMVRSGLYGSLEAHCPSVTDTLTQMIATAFIPRKNSHLFVLEFPALEHCVLDWLVKSDWESKVAREGYIPDEHPRSSEYFHADPRVSRLCLDIDIAIRQCLTHPIPSTTHGLFFRSTDDALIIKLPSGRELFYPSAEIMFGADGFSSIVYAGVVKDGEFDIQQASGAQFLQDIVQALMRDIVLDGLIRLSQRGYNAISHWGNKVIVDCEESAALMALCAVMEEPPAWASDLRINIQGYGYRHYLERKMESTLC